MTVGGPFAMRRVLAPRAALAWISERRSEFDVVELHEPLAAPYARARQRDQSLPPLVVLSHGLETRGLAAMIAYLDAKQRPLSLIRRWTPRTITWQADYAVRHADHVLCSNHDDIDALTRAGLPSSKISWHVNGVSEALLSLIEPSGEPRRGWLFLGSWIVRKGTLDLVPAMTAVLRRHPDWHFTAAGTGCDDDVVLREFPEDARGRVRVIRTLENDAAVASVYRAHAVCVLPSVFEGQPLALLEAAASAIAIVATNIAGIKDVITDGVDGRLVPVGAPSQLESALEAAMSDDPARGLRARARIIDQHLWRHSAIRLEAAYRAAIG